MSARDNNQKHVEDAGGFVTLYHGMHHKVLCENLWRQFDSKRFGDVAFVCDNGSVILAHRLVVASFSRLVYKVFNESACLSHHDLVTIIIPDVKVTVMRSVLNLIYYGCITVEKDEMDDFAELSHLLQISSHLKDEALKKYMHRSKLDVQSAASTYGMDSSANEEASGENCSFDVNGVHVKMENNDSDVLEDELALMHGIDGSARKEVYRENSSLDVNEVHVKTENNDFDVVQNHQQLTAELAASTYGSDSSVKEKINGENCYFNVNGVNVTTGDYNLDVVKKEFGSTHEIDSNANIKSNGESYSLDVNEANVKIENSNLDVVKKEEIELDEIPNLEYYGHSSAQHANSAEVVDPKTTIPCRKWIPIALLQCVAKDGENKENDKTSLFAQNIQKNPSVSSQSVLKTTINVGNNNKQSKKRKCQLIAPIETLQPKKIARYESMKANAFKSLVWKSQRLSNCAQNCLSAKPPVNIERNATPLVAHTPANYVATSERNVSSFYNNFATQNPSSATVSTSNANWSPTHNQQNANNIVQGPVVQDNLDDRPLNAPIQSHLLDHSYTPLKDDSKASPEENITNFDPSSANPMLASPNRVLTPLLYQNAMKHTWKTRTSNATNTVRAPIAQNNLNDHPSNVSIQSHLLDHSYTPLNDDTKASPEENVTNFEPSSANIASALPNQILTPLLYQRTIRRNWRARKLRIVRRGYINNHEFVVTGSQAFLV